MSVIRTETVTCPSCGQGQDFGLLHSVNADRRQDLRDAVLDGSLQTKTCEGCQVEFRIDPLFTYFHQKGGQWIAVRPSAELPDWRAVERDSQEIYAVGFGEKAPPAVQQLCAGLVPRVVFGWAALREKLVAAEAGIDDVQLELTKILVLRAGGRTPLGEQIELRLKEASGDTLVLDWIDAPSGKIFDRLEVPRELCEGIDPHAEEWHRLSQALRASLFVDLLALMFEPEAAAA